MQLSGTYSSISDGELDELVRDAQRGHPGIGLRMLMGYMLRTDPSGVHQRLRESIRRRVCRVSGPLALWHIDINHKLIRYSSYRTIALF